jgi:hypothetical protein
MHACTLVLHCLHEQATDDPWRLRGGWPAAGELEPRPRGQSLNATVLAILEAAVGVDERRRRLARYATWTQEDLEELNEALSAQRSIDDPLWR